VADLSHFFIDLILDTGVVASWDNYDCPIIARQRFAGYHLNA